MRKHRVFALVLAVALLLPQVGAVRPVAADTGLVFSVASLDFGAVLVGSPSAVLSVTVTNAGGTALSGLLPEGLDFGNGDVEFNDYDRGFGNENRCVYKVIFNSGESCTLNLFFRPSVAGARSGALKFGYGFGASKVYFTLPLSGTGMTTTSGPQTLVRVTAKAGGATGAIGVGGSVSVAPTGPVYASGTTLTLTATPLPGYLVADWNINGSSQMARGRNLFSFATGGEVFDHVIVAFNEDPDYGNPVPSLGGLSPTNVQAGGGAFTLKVGGAGFRPSSVVRWNGADRPTTYVSSTELRAQIGTADIAAEKVADIAVYSPAPGGGTSYPTAFFVTAGPVSVTASASGTSTDANGGATAAMGGTGPGTAGSLSATAQGAGTVTVARYATNPGGTPNFGVGSGGEATAFMDLYVSPGNAFTALRIVNCNLNGATSMYWWTGTAWVIASDQAATPTGCITVAVTATSSPNLGNLTGTYVAAGVQTGPPLVFADVPTTSAAYEPIVQLNRRGVIKGYGDGTFGPNNATLRAQMAVLIVRAMGWGGERPTNLFTDQQGVDGELWNAVAILAQRGVARGYGDGSYNPTGDVLYQQVILFVGRAMVERGFWQLQADTNPYPNLPGATAKEQADRRDIATYVHYAGALPDLAVGQAWGDWDRPATRAWFARALWQALVSHYGSPAQVP